MSVRVGKGIANNSDEIKKSVERVEAQQAAASALVSLAFQAQIKADRKSGTGTINDAAILQSKELMEYPKHSTAAVKYEKGDIVTNDGGDLLFEVIADHVSNAAYPLITTFAYYRLIELARTGTKDDPIPYPEAAGIVVNVQSGKYYAYKGKIYKATSNMPNCVYPPDTAGMWQWEAVK